MNTGTKHSCGLRTPLDVIVFEATVTKKFLENRSSAHRDRDEQQRWQVVPNKREIVTSCLKKRRSEVCEMPRQVYPLSSCLKGISAAKWRNDGTQWWQETSRNVTVTGHMELAQLGHFLNHLLSCCYDQENMANIF